MKFVRFVFSVLALLLMTASLTPPPANAQQNGPYQQNGSYGALRIDRAIYGRNGQGYDVTRRLRHWIRNNTIDIKVSNDNLGGDPNKGADKLLRVQYTYMGQSQSKVVKEGDRLKLP
jgi:hypothetical protein